MSPDGAFVAQPRFLGPGVDLLGGDRGYGSGGQLGSPYDHPARWATTTDGTWMPSVP